MLRPERQAPTWWTVVVVLVIGIPFCLALVPVLLTVVPALLLAGVVYVLRRSVAGRIRHTP